MIRVGLLLARIALVALLLIVGASGVTWYALEASDVAVVETAKADGGLRRTHVWFVSDDSELLLEAGTPENSWYRDVRDTRRLRIVEPSALARDCTPEVLANPDGRQEIRARMRAKYGWRDVWIGILFDTARSMAVRCAPA